MFFQSIAKKRSAELKQAEQVLADWQFSIVAEATLRIQPNGARLCVEKLAALLGRLRPAVAGDGLNEIVFDLGEVDFVGPNWTVAFALLMEFARGVKANCRIESLNGQPAAAASLYYRNRELMDLVRAGSRAA